MPPSALDILDDDPLGLFSDEKNKPKKGKKKKRRVRPIDIFEELGLNAVEVRDAITPEDNAGVQDDVHDIMDFNQPSSSSKQNVSKCTPESINIPKFKESGIPSHSPRDEIPQYIENNEYETILEEAPENNHGPPIKEDGNIQPNSHAPHINRDIHWHAKDSMIATNETGFNRLQPEVPAGDSLFQSLSLCRDSSPNTINERALEHPSESEVFYKEIKDVENSQERKSNTLEPTMSMQLIIDHVLPEESASVDPPQTKEKKPLQTKPPNPQGRRTKSQNAVSVEATVRGTKTKATILTANEARGWNARGAKYDMALTTIPRPSRPSSSHSSDRGVGLGQMQSNDTVVDPTDAVSLRRMVYMNWFDQHQQSPRDTRISQVKKETEEFKRKREEFEKNKSKEETFRAWKENKRDFFKEQLKNKKDQEQARQRKIAEENEKKRSSEEAFKVWKSRKDAVIAQQMRTKKQFDMVLRDSKSHEDEDKKTHSEKAFIVWKLRKESARLEVIHREKERQDELERKREEEARERLEKATEAYYHWESRKAASSENLRASIRKPSVTEKGMPWRPPSACPSGRICPI